MPITDESANEKKRVIEAILRRDHAPGFLSGHDKLILGSAAAATPFTGVLPGAGAAIGGLLGARMHMGFPKSVLASPIIAPLIGAVIGGLAGSKLEDKRKEHFSLLRKYLYNLPE